MPLPTVLMTDVIRSTQQGDSHGGAYLIDLERGTHERVLDWNEVGIDWEGRGAGRGLRGIVFHGDDIYIAASDELYVFDQSFNIRRSFKNPYLHHCHEIVLDGDRIYLTATTFDSILEFHIPTATFDRGTWLEPKRGPGGRGTITPVRFNPQSDTGGPPRGDNLHINSVWRANAATFVGTLRLPVLMAYDDRLKLTPYAQISAHTHNARPFGDGVLYNATGEDAIVIADRRGNVRNRYAIPKYDPSAMTHTDVPEDYARQGFGRGLCVGEDGVLIGGSSPSTVTAHHSQTGEILAQVNVSMDVRNCPHGLEIWPY
ncbi:MAG: hypothetical protein RIB60_08870 [Phycisphaerales bacterium]